MPSHPTLRFPTLTLSSSTTPTPTTTTTTAASNTAHMSASFSSKVERVVLSAKRQTTASTGFSRGHPMMQTTLPIDDEDEENQQRQEATEQREEGGDPMLHEDSGAAERIADINVPKKRVFGSDKIPSLNRSSSASATASRLVSKMAPMLRRVVSGTNNNNSNNSNNNASASNTSSSKSNNAYAPPKSPLHNFLDSDDEDRDSLLFMLQVPIVRRNSHIPLMAISHSDN